MLRGGLLLSRQATRRSALLRQIGTRPFATGLANLPQIPRPGDEIHGFTVKRTKHVPEMQLAAIELKHDKTGADYIHIAREDKNNVFAIGFKTNPNDNTGVPHILEHTTLCGSEKYPIRDPFFKMLNRSLSNYMNAFTSGDHTTYPFATTNKVDFNNLMDVYLDATLKPLLLENDFKQEGWRIGPENPSDPESPLLFKGVVYNEMKGQMSDSSYLYYIRFQDNIFPDLHNSGGDPRNIPDLTLMQLHAYHKAHYAPSNARIYTYGDSSLEEHLERINQKLDAFDRTPVDIDLRVPIALGENKEITVTGPIDPLTDKDAQYKMSVSWVTHDTSDVIESFSLRVMSSYLLDGYSSPLYKGLIDEKLGSDFSSNTGFDTSSKMAMFSVGLQNIREEDVKKVQDKIHQVLQGVHQEGFDGKKVDGILHQLELALKHRTATFGMSMMQGLAPAWFNGVDPFDALAWEETVSKFKERFAQGGYLESLLKKYLLDANTFTFTMVPDKDYSRVLAREEAGRLARELEKLGGESNARGSLVEQELKLRDVQQDAQNQDLSCLPTLKASDINREMAKKPLQHGEVGSIPVQWREAPTNGLTYFRAVNPLEDLPDELRMYLPLFTAAILRLGTSQKSMEQLEDEIKLKTGGIKASTHVSTNHSNLEVTEEGLVFSGYCLDKNVPDMLDLLKTVLLETNYYALSKLRTLIQGTASGFVDSLAESGHSFARTFAAAHLTPAARATEVLEGMTQVRLISKLAANEIYSDVLDKLRIIAQFAARQNGMRLAITCGPESVPDNERAARKFVDSLPIAETPQRTTPLLDFDAPSKAHFPLPYQVSYTAMCLKTVPYTNRDGAALQVLSQLLAHKHLHHEIREKGGAYGGGAFHAGLGGVFGFYSYRDPNVANTLQIMEKSGEFALQKEWTDRDLEEAKLSVFRGIDAPSSVSEEGMLNFLDGVTHDMRQRRREQLLDVGIADIRKVVQKYLIDQIRNGQTAIAVLGESKDMYDDQWSIFPLCLSSPDPLEAEKVKL